MLGKRGVPPAPLCFNSPSLSFQRKGFGWQQGLEGALGRAKNGVYVPEDWEQESCDWVFLQAAFSLLTTNLLQNVSREPR